MTYLVAGAGVEPALLAYERLIHFVLPAQLSGAMVLSPIDKKPHWHLVTDNTTYYGFSYCVL